MFSNQLRFFMLVTTIIITMGRDPYWAYSHFDAKNTILDCTFMGLPVCCSALNYSDFSNADNKDSMIRRKIHSVPALGSRRAPCSIRREYISSPYEEKHLREASRISAIQDESERLHALINFSLSPEEIKDSTAWLSRVSARSKQGYGMNVKLNITEDDLSYLSKFRVIKTCAHNIRGANASSQRVGTYYYNEFIEPLTIHNRHPFGWIPCLQYLPEKYNELQSRLSNYSRLNMCTDYLLFQSHQAWRNGSHIHNEPTSLSYSQWLQHGISSNSVGGRKYLFDVGTSRFESSLYYFICAYHQQGIVFDRIFGWENNILGPKDFWDHIPEDIHDRYHFYNTPASASLNRSNSPLRTISKVAGVDDFVALKIDIDTPSVEIPMVLRILKSPAISQLVDELFFELHYKCDVMLRCGWSHNPPDDLLGLNLTSEGALNLFLNLRKQGIRAHFWV